MCHVWQLPEEIRENIGILGYAIALVLKEQLDGEGAIAQILAHYQGAKSPLIQHLEQFQTFLTQKASLEEVIFKTTRQDNLKRSAIAMAFYCFSYTPEDLRLSLMRATRVEKQTTTTAALTGVLAGAYNGLNGIPLPWLVAIQRHPVGQRQAQKIVKGFAWWSGAYQSDRTDLLPSMAIASSSVIQPRPSLKIISQGEYPLTKTSHKVKSNVIKK
ncbi:MAG: ADP-ribosylglycohydrolase family protein [Hydrococcus sp. RM1_1_31]|nr:ADP-ribosylglycohydrolase family protein [Hydrococcus sp. RM1_1_31]